STGSRSTAFWARCRRARSRRSWNAWSRIASAARRRICSRPPTRRSPRATRSVPPIFMPRSSPRTRPMCTRSPASPAPTSGPARSSRRSRRSRSCRRRNATRRRSSPPARRSSLPSRRHRSGPSPSSNRRSPPIRATTRRGSISRSPSMPRAGASRRSIICSRSFAAIANGTTTARASSSSNCSRPGARATRQPWKAGAGCPRSYLLDPPAAPASGGARERRMPINATYRGPGDLPQTIPVFPLAGALLLPRGQMPLNIFEPRYLAMVDDALAGARVIGMIQPDAARPGPEARPHLYSVGCVGRITQLAETGDGRYLIELTGISRFRVEEELAVATTYRQCRVSYAEYADDFIARRGEEAVDRKAVLAALTAFLEANSLKADWQGIENAPNEALVNALAMMSPYGPAEKQALLEAPDLKTRAEILVAVTEIELAKAGSEGETPLQ